MISGGRRLNAEEEEAIRRELAELRQEHRDLDAAISFMVESGGADTIRVQRMKNGSSSSRTGSPPRGSASPRHHRVSRPLLAARDTPPL